MAVPNIFGTATSAIPLSQLDTNFATPVTIGNTAVQLGNTVTSFGNVTLTNVTISSGNVTITGANVSGTANVSALVVTGNQSFVGTGNRITGDMSNATLANRVAFQTSTTNGNTNVSVLPNGTGTTAVFNAYGNSDPTNASRLLIGLVTNATADIRSDITGTGTYLPMTFYTGGSERVRIDTSGNVGIGTNVPVGRLTSEVNSLGTVVNTLTLNNNSGGAGNGTALNFYASNASQPFTGRINSLDDGNFGYHTVFSNKVGGSAGAGALTERMRIDSSGNLLVGAMSSQNNSRLRITGGSTSGSNYTLLVEGSGGADNFYVRDDGEMYSLPTYNRTSASAVNVGIDASGGFFRSTSSIKYKTDVQDATHGLAEVIALRPVTYKGINDGELIFGGLIAEEVHEAGLTEFVQYADDGTPDALAYGNMISLCIKAIQEQQALIQSLTTRITALETK